MHFEHTSVFEKRYFLNTRAKNNREVSFLPGSVASPHAFPSPFKSIFSISSGHSAPREEEKEKSETCATKRRRRKDRRRILFVSSLLLLRVFFFFSFFFLQNFFCGGAGRDPSHAQKKAKIQSIEICESKNVKFQIWTHKAHPPKKRKLLCCLFLFPFFLFFSIAIQFNFFITFTLL